MKKNTLVVATLMLAMAGCQYGAPTTTEKKDQTQSKSQVNRVMRKASAFTAQGYVPGELIVKFKRGVSSPVMQQTMGALGLRKLQSLGGNQSGISLAQLPQGASLPAALQALNANPAVQYAEPNHIVQLPPFQAEPLKLHGLNEQPAAYPNDEMFAQQYAHKVSQSQQGWEINKGSENVVVAIVDTGVDLKHPDLADKLVPGRDIVDADDEARDGQGHGTHCAGIAAALTNNDVGVAGFAPNVKVMPVRVLDDQGSGTYADVVDGILWAADHGSHVISMSLGGPKSSPALEDAVKHALEKDVVVVAAMGNSGNGAKSYPAAITGVMAIGATDSKDKKASFSQYGTWISVGAPGVGILSTFPTYASGMPGTNYGSISGTSMATPAAAGLVALVRSQFPQLKHTEVRAQVERNADDLGDKGFDKYFGHGRINVAKALANAPTGMAAFHAPFRR